MLIVNIQKELGMMCGVDIIRKGMSHICLKLIVLILGGGMMRYELNFDEDKIIDIEAIGDNSVLDLKDCCKLLNNYDGFEKWVESLEISKSVELDELLKSINYILVRYNNTIVDDSDTVELKVSINGATGFSMELKRKFDV